MSLTYRLVIHALLLFLTNFEGDPTNWGLKEAMLAKHSSDMGEMRKTNYQTSYRREFRSRGEPLVRKRIVQPRFYVSAS